MFSVNELKSICKNYNIDCISIGEVIDTSKGKDDKRFNYLINDAYFLKINNIKSKDEDFLSDINLLINNYKSIGVYCPILYKTNNNSFSSIIEKDGIKYTCHMEEKSPYPIRADQDEEDYQFKKDVLEHVGMLASDFSNKNLSKNKSMWSLIELSASDTDVDEKQENFDDLLRCLNAEGYTNLVLKLNELNTTSRKNIKAAMKTLPRCVYQGDLNNSNIVVDKDGKFRGIIDFNMFGTEVNVNCFLNESMYYLTKNDFDELSAEEIFAKMARIQDDLMSVITKHYKMNKYEMDIKKDYKKIIFTSFYPNVALMVKLLEHDIHTEKVVDLLSMFCEL